GQTTSAIVSVEDVGGVVSLTFTVGGLVTSTESRTIDPAQNSVAAAFSIQVPATAKPGQTLTLDAVATDRAGNKAAAPRVILPVADTIAPTVKLATENGSLEMVRGRPLTILADAEDGIAISRVELTGQGALTLADAKPVSPPVGSARVSFTINVPDTLDPGATLTLRATAVDISGNVSSPAVLTLSVRSLLDVTLPPSAIVIAGDTVSVPVQLAEPAPAGGLRVDFTTADADTATVTPFVQFAAGETTKQIVISGVSGGSAAIRALMQGVQRATMTVTVRGGIVRGVVRNSQLEPVSGVSLTINGSVTAETDSNGEYFVEGVSGPVVSVKALDPATRQRGHTTALMNHGDGHAVANVILIPAGLVRGDVKTANGAVAGAGVTVEIFAANDLRSPLEFTFTDEAGQFEFPLVTTGNYVIEATSLAGHRGRSPVIVGADGDEEVVSVVFLGEGTVTGQVLDGAGTFVPRAPVTFRSSSIFGVAPPISINAEADGTFRFERVKIGSFTIEARDLLTGQGGATSGVISQNGQQVVANVSLSTFASLQGVVFRPDGVTVAVGATVRVHGQTALTNDQGEYSFAFLPLGAFTVTVNDEGTRQMGRATGALNTQGETQTLNITLRPQGSVIVTVNDASGVPVPGAAVNLSTSSNGLNDSIQATTGGDGKALIERVLAGAVNVTATAGALRGTAAFTLLADEVKPVTVTLEPTSSLAGVVYEPDGQTPAAGVVVRAENYSATTDANGNYRIDGLPLPPQYFLSVYDTQGRRRAFSRTPVKFTGAGQVVTRVFTMVGLGTVTGRVLNPDSSSAQNLSVTVNSFHPDFGGGRYGTTNAGGFYTIEDVPVAAFLVTTGNPAMQLLGEAPGTLDAHGATATVDIVLTSNAITPPVQRFDANNFSFDIQRNGATLTGSNAFRAEGAAVLDLVSNGVAQRFTGESIATVEDGGREIAVRQLNLHGLSVTRKIAVPRAGYFARYLEILTNPTSQPITVDVRLTSNLHHTLLLNTSSGNNAIELADAETADRWLMVDDAADGEGGTPSTAFVFDGPGAADRVGAATLSGASPRDLTLEWQNVTVPANSTVVYMHFVSQQTSRLAANTAAPRLMELGQEAIDGLSLEEIGAIRNFAVPANGQSLIAPLPRLDGQISGVVFEGDGTTPATGATIVTFRSKEPLFGRSYSFNTNGAGAFSLTPAFSDFGGTRVIPMAEFTLQARHAASTVLSPLTTGVFDDGALTAIRDVAFSNTGLWQGLVRRHNNVAVTSGTIAIAGQSHPIAADASFFFRGLLPGTYNATASISHPLGTGLQGNLAVVITAGQVTTGTLLIEPTGGARGRVLNADGSIVVAVQVRLQRSSFSRALNTDTAGQYEFQDVPAGTYSVRATDPATGLEVSQTVVVVQDQTATVADLAFAPKGTVQVEARLPRGAVVAGGSVYISEAARGNQLRHVGSTDGSGRLTITNVPLGAFTVRVEQPDDSRFYGESSGEIVSDGGVVSALVTLPAMGTVTGRVTNEDGSPAADVQVTVRSTHPVFGGFFQAQTDSNGVYRRDRVAMGNVSATVFDTSRQLFGEAFGLLDTDGQTVTLDIRLSNNAIGLPVARWDANNYYYDIAQYAGIQNGSGYVFSAYDGSQYGAALLDVVKDGTRHRFTGSAIGTVEQAGREISVRQQNVGGVDVSRKVFVPLEGYFARYVDTLSNPGTEPVTVALRLSTNSQGGYYYSSTCFCYRYHPLAIVRTSSGDTSLSVSSPATADRWLILEDTDPYKNVYGNPTPAVALIFDGANGDDRVASASYNVVDGYNGQVAYEWQNITIPPGGSVAYMHFVVQHSSLAAAQASAQRLSLLPPESLDGLTGEEL
ncbi:MAG TPA: carboxypeptidase regulatory-like domain-containing protein, partial [Vicinamibacterales bacterium]|nr:carboxypeptidase regulatory-like domain-containing protein [Vicinamibacterales bacterium]